MAYAISRTAYEQYEHDLAQARCVTTLEQSVRGLEKRVTDIETSYVQALEVLADVVGQTHTHKGFGPQNADMAKVLLTHAKSIAENARADTLNALADEVIAGAEDDSEQSLFYQQRESEDFI